MLSQQMINSFAYQVSPFFFFQFHIINANGRFPDVLGGLMLIFKKPIWNVSLFPLFFLWEMPLKIDSPCKLFSPIIQSAFVYCLLIVCCLVLHSKVIHRALDYLIKDMLQWMEREWKYSQMTACVLNMCVLAT